MNNQTEKMRKFIVVTHNWFIHSDGFGLHRIEARDFEEANAKGASIRCENEGRFSHCAFDVFEQASCNEIRGRKLSLMERLTGRLR